MAVQKASKKKRTYSNDRRNLWLLVFSTLLVLGSIFMFLPPQEKINQGLDIQGGLSVVLSAKSTDGSEISTENMEKSRAIIESRVNALGASEATVAVQGTNQILVQIPGLSDTEQALETIGKTGQLEFARLDSFTDETVKSNIESGQTVTQNTIQDEFGNSFPSEDAAHGISVEAGSYTPLVTGTNITGVNVGKESDIASTYAVNVSLDATGTEAFARATQELVSSKGKIVIILDGEVQNAPVVQSEIPDGQVSITGGYTQEDAWSLQTILESGSLPVSFEYSQSQVVGPTLGQDALYSGVLVATIGLLIVMLYLLFFYRGMGLVTAGAMLVFAILYLGILATLSAFGFFSLSLAGIAGIVLTIGMAADSSILTMERFREEIRMGRTVRAASITGVRHAIVTSIDADLVTMVSALSLFFLASASVKGFGLTLALGIICDILMMLIFKAPIIRLLAPRSISKHPGFWGIKDSLQASGNYVDPAVRRAEELRDVKSGKDGDEAAALEVAGLASVETGNLEETEGATSLAVAVDEAVASDSAAIAEATAKLKLDKPIKPDNQDKATKQAKTPKSKGRFIKRDINFLGHRKVFLIIAACMVVASFAIVGVRGVNFGIEFIGGTSVAFHGTGEISTDQMREAFEAAGEPDAVVQTTEADGDHGFLVRTTTTSAEEAASRANQVAEQFGLSTDSFEVTTIGPDWGASVIQSSLIAFLVSIILIIIYIAIRFEYKMGIMAIVSLLHDLVIVLGIYALVGREVNPNTIAALLTILGYSLYDTVVVFHRINDNMKESDFRGTFMTMANHSINQVLIRTLNTTLTSLIPVLAMLFFGGETLKDFAFAMTIGLVCGSYSSIAIAAPLYAMWKTREARYAKLAKKYGPNIDRFDFERPSFGASSAALADASTVATKGSVAKGSTAPMGGKQAVVNTKVPSNVSTKASASQTARPKSNHHYRRKEK